ncbi:MAG TPA: septal ring lytic transglycosylase RlpA family protein [Nitrospiria bacterium]
MAGGTKSVDPFKLFFKNTREFKKNGNSLFFIGLCFLFGFSLSACAGLQQDKDPSFRQKGMASWYGGKFHGRKTANGEIYNMYGLTAAHRSLPFGTFLKVTHQTSGKSVKVKINDRGPFVRGRFLDLSYGAARELGMVETGIAPVRVEVFHPKRDKGTPDLYEQNFTIQVASLRTSRSAEQLKKRLLKWYDPVVVEPFENQEGKFFRVRVGKFETSQEAHRMARKLIRHQGLEPFVTLTQN